MQKSSKTTIKTDGPADLKLSNLFIMKEPQFRMLLAAIANSETLEKTLITLDRDTLLSYIED